MPRNEDVSNAIWDDLDGLSNDAVLLYLWSFTNPRCGMAGIYRVPRRRLLDGRLDDDALTDALAELEDEGHAFYHDGVLWVKARAKRLTAHSENVCRAIARDLDELAGHRFHEAFVEHYRDVGWWLKVERFTGRFETVGQPFKKSHEQGKSETVSEPSRDGSYSGPVSGPGFTQKRPRKSPSRYVARARKVDGKSVTEAERELASEIVAAFNETADSSYTAEAHLTPLVMRVREHPDLDADEHRRIIAANFASPWWDDRPGPEVIYGNRRLFERSIERAKAGGLGSKPDYSAYDAKVRRAAA